MKRFITPCVLTLIVAACIFFSPDSLWRRSERASAEIALEESMYLPSAPILNLVIDREGAYIGATWVSIADVAKLVHTRNVEHRPAHIAIFGTWAARYGDFVLAYAAIRSSSHLPISVTTVPVRPGTRYEEITDNERGWPEEI